jgi:transcriptional antiterminator RfaH
MTAQPSPCWFVVQTRTNGETKAARNLERQGFPVYLPRYLKRRSHARKIEIVGSPLFPRYLFVAIDLAAQRWRSIQSTLGVSHLVCRGDRPCAVDDAVIRALKAREDQNGFIKLERRINFLPGDKVRLVEGAFTDSLALVEGVSERDRIAILLNFLGRQVRIFVDAEVIIAA